jgi:hypothetical protein
MSNQTFIAPHLRESVFRQYEGAIREMVTKWPQETCHSPFLGKSTATFLGYFRNAILSAQQFEWKTDVDLKKLRTMKGKYLIRIESDGNVWVRARNESKDAPAKAALLEKEEISSRVPWGDCTQDEISALCLLLHYSRLTGPFIIRGDIGDSLKESLSALYNVGIVFDPAQNQTVIT